ncbi:MAG: trypsin-like peptidase domain-containing protein [Armatimonadetes bacterium]|nr:trypsin-like peptidase domain-containing protein [Armatimonadota bacterium]
MNKTLLPKIAAGAALIAVAAAGGYTLRDTAAVAQSPKPKVAVVAQTPGVQNAVQMQTAFAEVARVAEPAVVTITTSRNVSALQQQRGTLPPFRMSPDGDNEELDEFFRQFRGLRPNSFESNAEPGNGFHPAQNAPRPAPRGGQVETGAGSGIIYDKLGLIITNAHVVDGADRVTVKLLDGREFKDAKVLGSDARSDIAVVKIPITDAPTVSLGDSSRVQVGDWAIAVGNPYGLSNTLTVGVISANAREVNLAEQGSLNDYLQTDASINPGNSGGALLDIYGRVIGVNNAIYSRTGGNVGIGFAIPINVAREVATALVKDGKVRRAIIGVAMSSVAAEDAAAYGLPAGTKGVIVNNVLPDTPASRAGVQTGDVITDWNGTAITRDADLQRKVAASPIGKPGTLTVRRGGELLKLTVTPREAVDETTPAEKPTAPETLPETPISDTLGVSLTPLSEQSRRALRIPETVRAGVVVARVVDNSPAARAGINVGDVITRVGQTAVTTVAEVERAKDALLKSQTGNGKSVAVYVTRPNGNNGYVVVQIGE